MVVVEGGLQLQRSILVVVVEGGSGVNTSGTSVNTSGSGRGWTPARRTG